MIDEEEKTRLLISIESSARKLKIQTYKAVVTIDDFVFTEEEWYMLSIVHTKPRISSSYVDVYLNGLLVQQCKCPYLGHPNSVQKIRTFFGFSPDLKYHFPHLAVLNVGPTYFMQETLLKAKDILTIFHIGSRYSSNFQEYHLDKRLDESTSSLSTQLSEDKILISFHPKNHLSILSTSYQGEKSDITHATIKHANINAIYNSSVANISESFDSVSNLAYIKGNCLLVCPSRLNDGIWKIGGMGVLLKLIEISHVCFVLT